MWIAIYSSGRTTGNFKAMCYEKLHEENHSVTSTKRLLRIFQRNGLKLDKDLIFSGLVQNVYVYRMAKSKKIWPFRFNAINF